MELLKLGLGSWLLLIFGVYILCWLSDYSKSSRIRSKSLSIIWAVLGSSILIFFSGMRHDVGDTPVYLHFFEQKSIDLKNVWENINLFEEGGFELLQVLIKRYITENPYHYIFVIAFITLVPILHIFYKYGKSFSLCVLIFILSGNYVISMNGMRQFLVSAILFACFKWIYEKKYIRYIFLVLILSTIHKSALFFVMAPFILNLPAWGKGSKGIIVGGVLTYIIYPISSQWFSFLLSETSYSGYGEGIVSGAPGGANIIRAFIYMVPIVIGYMMRKSLSQNEKYYNIMVNASIFNFIFMLLATAGSWIFARYCIYFSLYSIMLLVWSIHYMKKDRQIYWGLCVGCYLVFFMYEMQAFLK